MSPPIVFRRVAKLEMDESIAWYESRRVGLGMEFAAEVDRFLQRIGDKPEIFPQVRQEVRRAVLHRFPYTIHFLPESDRIVVLAVFHAKRNPRILEDR